MRKQVHQLRDTRDTCREVSVEIARQAYQDLADALTLGDYLTRSIERWCDPQIVLKPSGLFPDSSEMRGSEGMRRFVTTQAEAFEVFKVEPLEFIDTGDRVVVPLRFGGRARHTGLEIDFSVVHVLTLRDGKILRIDMYTSKPHALEAIGLYE